MRGLLTATLIAGTIGLAGAVPASAAPAGGAAAPASLIEQVQYGGYYRPYRQACPYGYHWACSYDYSGYRRCACRPDAIYRPGPGYVPGPGYGPGPSPGYGQGPVPGPGPGPGPGPIEPY